jgi:S-adenosylmethionine synthetase
VLVQVAYAIGVAAPLSIHIDSYGTVVAGKTDADLLAIVNQNFDLRPGVLRRELGLTKPIYEITGYFGHFGRVPNSGGLGPKELNLPSHVEGSFSWEKPKTLKF